MGDFATFEDRTLVQGTTEWKRARVKRIGGSDIAVILGISPYKTRRQLWLEKTGVIASPEIGHLPHVRRGIDAEPIARGILERKYRVKYLTPTLLHHKHPQLSVSLDGLCNEHIIEIKTMGENKHWEVSIGHVPEYYEPQCQWGMALSGRSLCIFASYRPEDGTMHEVLIRADAARQRHMLACGLQFHRWCERGIEPPDAAEGMDLGL